MLHRASLAVLISLTAAGCTDAEPETTSDEQGLAACSCAAPTPVGWVPGRVTPRSLFPAGVTHLHTFLSPADTSSFYAWGIAHGEVLWLYQVNTSDAPGFLAALNQAWMEAETTAGISHSVGGWLKGPPPPPPVPIGGPRFTPAYVSRVLASAQQHEDTTELELSKLGAM